MNVLCTTAFRAKAKTAMVPEAAAAACGRAESTNVERVRDVATLGG